MKVIDLLNKIANGEEVPNFIIDEQEYYLGADGVLKELYGDAVEWALDAEWLNTKVEIIEEPKKIEKIQTSINENYIGWTNNEKVIIKNIINLADKINEIIDEINRQKS